MTFVAAAKNGASAAPIAGVAVTFSVKVGYGTVNCTATTVSHRCRLIPVNPEIARPAISAITTPPVTISPPGSVNPDQIGVR